MLKLFTTALLMMPCMYVSAQSMRISGIVTDKLHGKPLPGVSISEKGTSNGTSTDISGRYTINVNDKSARLIFSSVGYETIAVNVTEDANLNIVLAAKATNLSETVVTALGMQREKRALGYTVQKLNNRDINEVKSVNFVEDLSGKIAGVAVTTGSTGVGSTSKITIRGESSFSNNNPLFVVDGVPVNNNTVFNVNNEAATGF